MSTEDDAEPLAVAGNLATLVKLHWARVRVRVGVKVRVRVRLRVGAKATPPRHAVG